MQPGNTKFARCRENAAVAGLCEKLDVARKAIERGRMPRQQVKDAAAEVAALFRPAPVLRWHTTKLQQQCESLEACVQRIAHKPVTDVCAADAKEINERIDEIVAASLDL